MRLNYNPVPISQGTMYSMRGNVSDGMPYRNRSAEQYSSASGNPNMPIFNSRSNASYGGIASMRDPRQSINIGSGWSNNKMPVRIDNPRSGINIGSNPYTGMVEAMMSQRATAPQSQTPMTARRSSGYMGSPYYQTFVMPKFY